MTKLGKLIKNNVVFYDHEEDSINFLLSLGHNIEMIHPSNTQGIKNPDIWMNGRPWELKTPITNNLDTLERKITKGGRQAENIIIDLRFTKISEEKAIKVLTAKFRKSRRVKKLLIITKNRQLVSINKK